MHRRRKRSREYGQVPEIVLTPLIDTALCLLVIFMVTVPMVQNGIKVDLPQGQSKEVGGAQELVVTLSKDNKVYFNSYPVDNGTLCTVVKDAIGTYEDRAVYVHADKTLSYGRVIEIVDELKQSGVRYVAMSTRASAATT